MYSYIIVSLNHNFFLGQQAPLQLFSTAHDVTPNYLWHDIDIYHLLLIFFVQINLKYFLYCLSRARRQPNYASTAQLTAGLERDAWEVCQLKNERCSESLLPPFLWIQKQTVAFPRGDQLIGDHIWVVSIGN
jgi:hypothetical protein